MFNIRITEKAAELIKCGGAVVMGESLYIDAAKFAAHGLKPGFIEKAEGVESVERTADAYIVRFSRAGALIERVLSVVAASCPAVACECLTEYDWRLLFSFVRVRMDTETLDRLEEACIADSHVEAKTWDEYDAADCFKKTDTVSEFAFRMLFGAGSVRELVKRKGFKAPKGVDPKAWRDSMAFAVDRVKAAYEFLYAYE